jgi:hypothetical protein
MQQHITLHTQLNNDLPTWKPLAGENIKTEVFPSLEIESTKKKRWNTSMELEYDPVRDLFVDAKTKRPVQPLLDCEADEQYFDDTLFIDALTFHSDNSEWIKRGGACALDMEQILNVKGYDPTFRTTFGKGNRVGDRLKTSY